MAREPERGGPVGVGAGRLAQALQFCLGFGMAKGPEGSGRPALGPTVLVLVAGVQAAHVEGAEEAALSPRVVLHQSLQAGELGRQVLGEEGASVPAFPSPWLLPGINHSLTWDPAPLQRGGNPSSERSLSCSQQSQTPFPVSLLPD